MFWKTYFRLMAALFVVVLIGVFFGWEMSRINGPLDAVSWVSMLMSLVGLYGYAWKRQILSPRFWQFYVPIAIVWDIAYDTYLAPTPVFTSDNIPELLIAMPLILPLYYALIRYAYGGSVYRRGETAGASAAI